MLVNDTLDDLRPSDNTSGEYAHYGGGRRGGKGNRNYEVYDSQQFDPKKSGMKKSIQNMKSVLQKARDQAVGMIGKSTENGEDMMRLRMDSQRMSLNAVNQDTNEDVD